MIPNLTVHRAKKGDMLARAWLYEQFSKPLYNLSIKLLGNVPDAEDVIQDSFIQAFDKIDQLKKDELFGAWLKKIVVNKCFSQLQKRKLNFLYVEFDEQLDVASENSDGETGYTPVQINEGIAQLPNGCRQIFVLYLLENYSHKEIAGLLKISESTSKSQYQYAKKLLRNFILKKKRYEF
jgi:RNA polymerase sigma-70 factor (ECF subfamily)